MSNNKTAFLHIAYNLNAMKINIIDAFMKKYLRKFQTMFIRGVRKNINIKLHTISQDKTL